MSIFENNIWGKNNDIPPKIQEYINRIKSGNEKLEDFGDIPESWKKIIIDNTTNTCESSTVNKNELTTTNETEQQLKPRIEIISFEGKEINLENLKDLDQYSFAVWLQNNKYMLENREQHIIVNGKKRVTNAFKRGALTYYELLTLRPEYRSQAIIDANAVAQKQDFDQSVEYFHTTMAEQARYANSDYNPDWIEFSFGNTRNTEIDAMRRKGYITIDNHSLLGFKEKIKNIIYDLQNILTGKYNGSFKLTQNLSKLVNQFDNFVVHGGNEQEVDIALDIISDVLNKNGIENKITQKGKDGKNKKGEKTSHTQMLEEKIIHNEL